MIKSKLIFILPLWLGIVTVIVDFLPENLPAALSDYRNLQDIQGTDFSFSVFLRLAFFLFWFGTYFAAIEGDRKYLNICIISFVGFIVSKLFFGPIILTAEIAILQQLTILSVGFILGLAYKNGPSKKT